MDTNTILPFEATHPGILIQDELEVRDDITQKELAILLGVKPSFLNEIIKGKRPITADIAILLEKALDIPADYWMKFQSQYEIDLAKLKEKNITKLQHLEFWKVINQYVPVKYFKKCGYLIEDLGANIAKVLSIYAVTTIDGLVKKVTEKRFAFFKKSEKLQIEENNLIAWTSLAAFEANKKETNTFHFDNLQQLNIELQEIFYQNKDVVSLVDKKLAQYGIKFLLIDKLDKTPIDGYSFWSNQNPVIALTLRHQRIDNFAFTMMHELGHIALHLKDSKDQVFIDLTKMEEDLLEQEANVYAQNSLIPSKEWQKFKDGHKRINDNVICKFAETYKIHPAIVLGRVCYENNKYNVKTKIDKTLY